MRSKSSSAPISLAAVPLENSFSKIITKVGLQPALSSVSLGAIFAAGPLSFPRPCGRRGSSFPRQWEDREGVERRDAVRPPDRYLRVRKRIGVYVMANRTRLLTAVAFGGALWAVAPAAQAQSNIAVVNQQAALINTKDGQTAVKQLTDKYTPKQKELEGKQAELAQLSTQLQAGTALAPEKRAQLQRQFDEGNRLFTRDRDDIREQYQADQQRLLVPIEQRMQAVIAKFAQQKGFALVLDTNGPVVFASSTIDVTKDIVTAFDNTPAVMPTNVPAAIPQKQAPPKPISH